MASKKKSHFLIYEKRFWEITIDGKTTRIRSGKYGSKGRTYPLKQHLNFNEAKKFAMRNVNVKIIQGFKESEESPMLSYKFEKHVSKSIEPKMNTKPPLKKRETPRRLALQHTITNAAQIAKSAERPTPVKTKPPWRKPHRKQSTIRRMARCNSKNGQNDNGLHYIIAESPALLDRLKVKPPNDATRTPQKKSKAGPSHVNHCGTVRRQLLFGEHHELTPPSSSDVEINGEEETGIDGIGYLSNDDEQEITALRERVLGTLHCLRRSDTMDVEHPPDRNNNSRTTPPITPTKRGRSKSAASPSPGKRTRSQTSSSQNSLANTSSRVSPRKNLLHLKSPPSLTNGSQQVYLVPKNQWPQLFEKSPVIIQQHIMSCSDNSLSRGFFINDDVCLIGDDQNCVIEMNSNGETKHILQLPSNVRVIIHEDGFFYAGCENGEVYDISQGMPRCVYKIDILMGFNEIQGLAYHDGILVVSDTTGLVAAIDHTGQVLWKQRSQGMSKTLLLADDSGVYHGHFHGLTKYDLREGIILWQQNKLGFIQSGCSSSHYLYVANHEKTYKINKTTGKPDGFYIPSRVSAINNIRSVSYGGGLVFLADASSSSIYCFEEKSCDLIYKFQLEVLPLAIEYHSGRIYCVSQTQLLVLSLAKDSILQGLNDIASAPYSYKTQTDPKAVSPLENVPSISRLSKGIIVECATEGDVIVVKPTNKRFKKQLSCEFPVHLRQEGSRYVVDQLVQSRNGSFYRVTGDIKLLQQR